MEKSNNKNVVKKKRNLSSIIVFAFSGVFIYLCLKGIEHICPEYLESKKKKMKDSSEDLNMAAAIVEYGITKAIFIIFILPIIFNVLFYTICGFRMTVTIQCILYFVYKKDSVSMD